MKDPRLEAEDLRQARGEYDEDFGQSLDELVDNIARVAKAAIETREGDITFMQALRRGGFFGRAN